MYKSKNKTTFSESQWKQKQKISQEQVVRIWTIPGHLAGSLRGVPESSGDSDHAAKLQFFLLQLCCPLHMLSLPLSLFCYGGDGGGRGAAGGRESLGGELGQRELGKRDKQRSLSLTDRRTRSIDDRSAHRPLWSINESIFWRSISIDHDRPTLLTLTGKETFVK